MVKSPHGIESVANAALPARAASATLTSPGVGKSLAHDRPAPSRATIASASSGVRARSNSPVDSMIMPDSGIDEASCWIRSLLLLGRWQRVARHLHQGMIQTRSFNLADEIRYAGLAPSYGGA